MVFGKTVECLRKRTDPELVTNLTRAKKLIAKSTTLHWDIIIDNIVSVSKQKPKIIVDRPIYLASVFRIVRNYNVHIPLRGDFEQVRITC